jgi:hypothetical protein
VDKDLFIKFSEKVKLLDDKNYIFTLIDYHAAPTIRKVKAASTIAFRNTERKEVYLWKKYGEEYLLKYSISCIVIKEEKDICVVLFYYDELLKKVLRKDSTMDFLSNFGYSENMNLEEILLHLKSRFADDCPHELGLFLGIPLEDVKDFIYNPLKRCIFTGYWKVYNNEETARRIFNCYDMQKQSVMNRVIDINYENLI